MTSVPGLRSTKKKRICKGCASRRNSIKKFTRSIGRRFKLKGKAR